MHPHPLPTGPGAQPDRRNVSKEKDNLYRGSGGVGGGGGGRRLLL